MSNTKGNIKSSNDNNGDDYDDGGQATTTTTMPNKPLYKADHNDGESNNS